MAGASTPRRCRRCYRIRGSHPDRGRSAGRMGEPAVFRAWLPEPAARVDPPLRRARAVQRFRAMPRTGSQILAAGPGPGPAPAMPPRACRTSVTGPHRPRDHVACPCPETARDHPGQRIPVETGQSRTRRRCALAPRPGPTRFTVRALNRPVARGRSSGIVNQKADVRPGRLRPAPQTRPAGPLIPRPSPSVTRSPNPRQSPLPEQCRRRRPHANPLVDAVFRI